MCKIKELCCWFLRPTVSQVCTCAQRTENVCVDDVLYFLFTFFESYAPGFYVMSCIILDLLFHVMYVVLCYIFVSCTRQSTHEAQTMLRENKNIVYGFVHLYAMFLRLHCFQTLNLSNHLWKSEFIYKYFLVSGL